MPTQTPQHAAFPQLKRRRLGALHLVFFTVAASAPLTVLGGGVTTTFAVTGIPGVPLSFLVLAVALGLFAVGYAAMSRYVTNAGAFYSYLTQGLGRTWAVAGSFVALLSYNAIQIGLYGLFGVSLGDFFSSKLGVDLPWWIWGLAALVVVGALGMARVDLNARVLAVFLTLECIAVVIYDISAFTHPAGDAISTAGLQPSQLLQPGIGAVFAFGVAAFIGFESSALYSEECVNPRRTVARATYTAVVFTGLFYALSSWAMTVTVGPENLQKSAAQGGPGLVFNAIAEHLDPLVADLAYVLFLTSVFAALLSFHNGVARYFFALGRERVLPTVLGKVGARSGGPVAGSLVQSAIALIVLAMFALSGANPLLQMFTWLSGLSAVGVILLMTGTSAAVLGFFARHQADESLWHRKIAPGLAYLMLAALGTLLVVNFGTLIGGAETSSPLAWILPGLVFLSAVLGLIWGRVLQTTRPDVYDGIGRSVVTPIAEDENFVLPKLREEAAHLHVLHRTPVPSRRRSGVPRR
jgi:amino acid transporter